MRHLAILLLLIVSCAFTSTTAGTFLHAPASVESMSRGGLAIDRSSAGFIKNPAVLSQQQQSIYITQGTLLDEAQYMALAYVPAHNPNQIAFGSSLIHTGLNGIQETNYDSLSGTATYTGKTFGYSAQAYIFGAALPLGNEHTSLGLNIKFIREQLYTESGLGFGCDLGFNTSWENLDIGLSALNLIQPQIRWSTGATYAIDRKIIMSTAYHYTPTLTFIADVIKNEVEPLTVRLGAEYTLFSFIAIRGSYGPSLALGTGLHYGDLKIDYAYIDNEKTLGKTQYVGLAYLFGNTPTLTALPVKEIIKTAEIVPTPQPTIETAEIKPLPLPEAQAPIVELVTPDIVLAPAIIEPILENTTEDMVTVSIPEPTLAPVSEYQIAVVSPRYFSSGKLQIKVFVNNTGNQTDTITANLKIITAKGKTLLQWPDEAKLLIPKETGVYYFTMDTPLKPGTYYLEVQTRSTSVTRYEKEAFIVR